MSDSDTENPDSGTIGADSSTMSPKLVSMRGLANALGVTLRAVQLAEMAGRISVVERRSAGVTGKQTRCFFDLEKSMADFKGSSFRSQPLATRREQGKGNQPAYTVKSDRETPVGRHTHEGAIEARRLIDEGKAPVPLDTKPPTEERDNVPEKSTYTKLKEAKEALSLQSARLDMDERQGKLVSTEEAKLLYFQMANITTQNLLNIPDRIAPLVAVETDQRICRDLIMTEIKQALTRIADGELQFKFKTA